MLSGALEQFERNMREFIRGELDIGITWDHFCGPSTRQQDEGETAEMPRDRTQGL